MWHARTEVPTWVTLALAVTEVKVLPDRQWKLLIFYLAEFQLLTEALISQPFFWSFSCKTDWKCFNWDSMKNALSSFGLGLGSVGLWNGLDGVRLWFELRVYTTRAKTIWLRNTKRSVRRIIVSANFWLPEVAGNCSSKADVRWEAAGTYIWLYTELICGIFRRKNKGPKTWWAARSHSLA